MYWAMLIALVVFVLFSVGTTYLLCKAMLWLMPGGKDDDEV